MSPAVAYLLYPQPFLQAKPLRRPRPIKGDDHSLLGALDILRDRYMGLPMLCTARDAEL